MDLQFYPDERPVRTATSRLDHSMADTRPLILLPGLGADGRMFNSIRPGLPQLVTPAWIEPLRHESIADYAQRYARQIDPGRPCYIGGASFGGVMAQEVAAILPNARACFVIGSLRFGSRKPWRIRALRPITPLVGILPRVSPLLVRIFGSVIRPPTRGIMMQLSDADARFLRWGAQSILSWQPAADVGRVRICQIHGERDRVFPIQMTEADLTVPGAGHLIVITHPQQVLQFIRSQIELIESQSNDD